MLLKNVHVTQHSAIRRPCQTAHIKATRIANRHKHISIGIPWHNRKAAVRIAAVIARLAAVVRWYVSGIFKSSPKRGSIMRAKSMPKSQQ